MPDRPWFETFFDEAYLPLFAPYLSEERTRQEVEFVVSTLALPAGSAILDLACGRGRILLPLAARGYHAIGLDLSPTLLAMSQADAVARALPVRLIRADMRHLPLRASVDAVISMFTAFGYFETEAENQSVLDAVATALRPGGAFLLDVANPLAVFRHFSPRDWLETDGLRVLISREYDFQTGRSGEDLRIIRPDGAEERRSFRVRLYTLPELRTMLGMAGLVAERVLGGTKGEEYGFESPRLIVLSRKPE